MPPHVGRFPTIIRCVDQSKTKYPPGHIKLSKDPNHRIWRLCQYKKLTTPWKLHIPPGVVMLLQSDATINTTVSGSNSQFYTDVTCYQCQSMGHYAGNFLSSTLSTRVGLQLLQIVLKTVPTMNNTPEHDMINSNFILLYTCYIISSVNNKYILLKIDPLKQAKNSRHTWTLVANNTATLLLWW